MDGDRRLSRAARSILDDASTPCFFSAASVWEASIKRNSGKLPSPESTWGLLEAQGFVALEITIAHAEAAGSLPLHHTDPFDRMLVAQAQLEGLSIMTSDPAIERYAVHVLAA